MSVLDSYKRRCEKCRKSRTVCTKHFYIYCADSKLEQFYLKDKKAKKIKPDTFEGFDEVIAQPILPPTIITEFSIDDLVDKENLSIPTPPHNKN